MLSRRIIRIVALVLALIVGTVCILGYNFVEVKTSGPKRVRWTGRDRIVKVVLSATLTILIASGVNVDGRKSQDSALSVIRPVINERGWKIPGLAQSRMTGPRKLLSRTYGAASLPLHITTLKPPLELITTIPIYRLKDGQTLIITERKVAIDAIIKADVNNRDFVYILQCTIILEEPDGRTGYSGMFGVHYYDHDGDGKFESFEEGAPFVTPELRVPEWVSKSAR